MDYKCENLNQMTEKMNGVAADDQTLVSVSLRAFSD